MFIGLDDKIDKSLQSLSIRVCETCPYYRKFLIGSFIGSNGEVYTKHSYECEKAVWLGDIRIQNWLPESCVRKMEHLVLNGE